MTSDQLHELRCKADPRRIEGHVGRVAITALALVVQTIVILWLIL